MQLSGAFTALVTPFKNGAVDEEKYREFIEWQIQEGINGLVPCGTTGESVTLNPEEHEKVIAICIDQVKKRVPVIAGTGGNCTAKAIQMTKFAKKAGADASLSVTPYYNKPTQGGLVAHYKAIADEGGLPLVVYNVPGRTGVSIAPATMKVMVDTIPQVIAIKEATGSMIQVSDIIEQCGDRLTVLSGDDFTLLTLMALGGKGVISVASNAMPKAFADLCKAALNKDMDTARKIHYSLQPICRACFIETNPTPIKAIMGHMGMMTPELRLPLVPMLPENDKKLQEVIKEYGLIK